MIYDNPYCVKIARYLVAQYGDNHQELTKEIAGELNRLFRQGQVVVITRVNKAVDEANKAEPR